MEDFFGTIQGFYKNVIGSKLAFLGFVVFLITIAFIYWIVTFDGAVITVQTYFFHYVGPYVKLIKTLSTIIILVFSVGIVYVVVRINEIQGSEDRKYQSIKVEEKETHGHTLQWKGVQEHIYSDVPAQWRVAILEADSMLDEALKKAGGRGDSLGERLKSLDASGFQTLQSAWDAHKVRNLIAHQGESFQLTRREAVRVIDLYEKVLEEVKYI